MSGVYWGLAAMALLGALPDMDEPRVLAWLLRCRHPNGAFGANEGHDAHILYTYSAVQILALYNRLDLADADAIASYIAELQQPDGSFAGDEWGEVDTRFSYCALACLSLLGRLGAVEVARATDYVASCRNFDGGFGNIPGGESHAGQIFCCVAALQIGGALHLVDRDLLGWWLCERQVPSGGLNGRPEKLPDVCYSWWVLSSLVIIDRLHWIHAPKLRRFILRCQRRLIRESEPAWGARTMSAAASQTDRKTWWTYFTHSLGSLVRLSLMGHPALAAVDPVYALPVATVESTLQMPPLQVTTPLSDKDRLWADEGASGRRRTAYDMRRAHWLDGYSVCRAL
eukprot:SM000354S13397  [mRNA]  locus=s354:72461:75047:+ [translate_table: standard]